MIANPIYSSFQGDIATSAEKYTKKIRNNMTRDGGRLDIFYSMKIGGVDRAVKMKIETL